MQAVQHTPGCWCALVHGQAMHCCGHTGNRGPARWRGCHLGGRLAQPLRGPVAKGVLVGRGQHGHQGGVLAKVAHEAQLHLGVVPTEQHPPRRRHKRLPARDGAAKRECQFSSAAKALRCCGKPLETPPCQQRSQVSRSWQIVAACACQLSSCWHAKQLPDHACQKRMFMFVTGDSTQPREKP